MIYEIKSLDSSRRFLKSATEQIILSNPPGSTRYYGMRVIDYIFKTLKREFPDIISGFIVNAYDDYSALITARKLGYKNIKYL